MRARLPRLGLRRQLGRDRRRYVVRGCISGLSLRWRLGRRRRHVVRAYIARLVRRLGRLRWRHVRGCVVCVCTDQLDELGKITMEKVMLRMDRGMFFGADGRVFAEMIHDIVWEISGQEIYCIQYLLYRRKICDPFDVIRSNSAKWVSRFVIGQIP